MSYNWEQGKKEGGKKGTGLEIKILILDYYACAQAT